MTPRCAVLAFRGVTKRFGGATALDDVDFELLPGEIHGLVGENGAGKSTLMKILSGVHVPDEGEMLLRGEPVRFGSPAEAKARGIGMIYQELSCMPALTVAENVFLGSQPMTRSGLIDWKRMRREAGEHLSSLGIDVDVTEPARQPVAGRAATGRDRPGGLFRRLDHRARRADLGALRCRKRSGSSRRCAS